MTQSSNTTDDDYDDVMMVMLMVIYGSLFIFSLGEIFILGSFKELYIVGGADGFDPGLMWTDPGKSPNAAASLHASVNF